MTISRSLLLTCAVAAMACAQEFRATLQGTVLDSTHAALASATVVLRSNETGIDRQATTDEDGHYLFSFLVPGSYTLTFRASGFKTAVRENVQLAINDNLKLDVDMELGQVTETIEVNASVATVQAD